MIDFIKNGKSVYTIVCGNDVCERFAAKELQIFVGIESNHRKVKEEGHLRHLCGLCPAKTRLLKKRSVHMARFQRQGNTRQQQNVGDVPEPKDNIVQGHTEAR